MFTERIVKQTVTETYTSILDQIIEEDAVRQASKEQVGREQDSLDSIRKANLAYLNRPTRLHVELYCKTCGKASGYGTGFCEVPMYDSSERKYVYTTVNA